MPYWDFDDPDVATGKAPRDASAAAIAASGMLELSTFLDDEEAAKKYWTAANGLLHALTNDKYLARDKNNAMLLSSTGHKTANSEVDVPIIYADYYFVEALLREKALQASGKSFCSK